MNPGTRALVRSHRTRAAESRAPSRPHARNAEYPSAARDCESPSPAALAAGPACEPADAFVAVAPMQINPKMRVRRAFVPDTAGDLPETTRPISDLGHINSGVAARH